MRFTTKNYLITDFNTPLRQGGQRQINLRSKDSTTQSQKKAESFPWQRQISNFPLWEKTRERWTAASLAVWFMDDGGAGGHSKLGIVIDVSGWGYGGRLEAQRALKSVYGLDSTFQGTKDNAVKLFIPERSVIRFRDLVKPYIVPSQRYKIAHLF